MKKIVRYSVVTAAVTFIFGFLFIYGKGELGGWPRYVLAVIPAITAIAFNIIEGNGLKGLQFRKVHILNLFKSAAVPVLYGSVILGILILLGFNQISFDRSVLVTIGVTAMGAVMAIPIYLGEEIGWRGYLQEKMIHKLGYDRGIILLGLIWGFWHLPAALNGLSLAGLPLYEALVFYPLFCIASSYIISGVMGKERSIWSAVVLHSFNNSFMSLIMTQTLRNNILGESVVTLLVMAIAAFYFRFRYVSSGDVKNVLKNSL